MKICLSARLRSYKAIVHVILYGLLALFTVACAALPIPAPALSSVPSPAQDKTSEIDQLFSWATPETPGCAVAVSQHGEMVVNRAYGLANLERSVPIDPSTMFDVGSVQKQFVAAAILLLVEDGRIALTDDIRDYFPELPDYGHTITVDHLLTHTSGLRDWPALFQLSSESEDALTLIQRQRDLNFAPGEEWSYSNSGYVLLKELIARTTGMSFSAFAQERLFEPLGMEMTTYADDVRDVEDRALAYEKEDDDWRLNILVGNERGDGGALLSTAGDLLIWNEALTNARLSEFVSEKLQEPTKLNNSRELSYARGLFLDENPQSRIVWHTGSAAAYKTMLARFPDQGLSLAILCNAGESGPLSANAIVDLFIPDMGEADADEPTATADAEDIDVSGKAGLFFSESTGEPLHLVVHEGELRIPGGPPLVAMAEDHFRIAEPTLNFKSEDEFELHFLSPDQLVLTSMEGETTEYRRAQPYAPTADDLQAFVGRYESDELKALFEITPGDDGLTVRLNGSQPFEFMPVDTDTFQLGRMFLRFRWGESGDVVGIDYSNPVLRNLEFTKSDSNG